MPTSERTPKFNLTRIIEQTEAIPTLSKVYARVQRMVSDPDTTASELARVVESDQAFTLRLLQLSNSAEQARLSAVTTVKQAIVVLGFRTVRAAALSSSVMGSMEHYASPDVEQLWERAYATATASRLLAARLNMAEPEEAFVLGLVQNMGQIILGVKATAAYTKVRKLIDEHHEIDLLEAENRVLGINHQEVGYILARRWQLPDVIAHVTFRHHEPERAGKFRGPATLVYLADTVARALGIGSDGDNFMRPLQVSAARWKKLGLNTFDLEQVMKQTLEEQSGFEEFYSTNGTA